MLEDIQLTVGQSFLISITSGLFGFLVNHWLAVGRERRKELHDAAKEFRGVFVEMLRLLEINPPTDPARPPDGWQISIKLLRKFNAEHHSAVIRFEQFLPWYKKVSFRKHWNEYCCYDKQNGCATFSDYEPGHIEDEPAKRRLAITRINRVIKFARV